MVSQQYDERFEKLFDRFSISDFAKDDKSKDLKRLALKFFLAFSRFEYALKKASYLKSTEEEANAEPSWDKFANDSKNKNAFEKQKYSKDKSLQCAIDFLVDKNTAPKKQVVENGKLGWAVRNTEGQSELYMLVRSITTVRNNLFHGAKFIDIFQGVDSTRSYQLLDSSLIVLGNLLDLDSEVNKYFSAGM